MFLLLLSIPIINVLLLNVFEYLLGKRNSFVFVTHSYLFLMCVSINAFVNVFIFFDVIYITLGVRNMKYFIKKLFKKKKEMMY